MKRVFLGLLIVFFLFGCGGGNSEKAPQSNLKPIDHQWTDYSALLTDYVADGLVDYKTLKADRPRLDALVDVIATADLSQCSDDRQLAFYLNAYNILVLRSVIDAYPIASIQDIKGVWDKNEWTVSGDQFTLNDLEEDVIRGEFGEPKIHFALAKAAKGGPKLQAVPFIGDILGEQLAKAGKDFATDTKYNWIDPERKKVGLSKIFEWYGEDFHKKYYLPGVMLTLCQEDNAAVNFILSYYPKDRRAELQQINFTAQYLDFDWSLNEQ
ncbi:MAG: DUF547 domain-containing protein [Candidatus Zixiibacteriota bacterium]